MTNETGALVDAYTRHREWADQFNPLIIELLSELTERDVVISSFHDDVNHCVDFETVPQNKFEKVIRFSSRVREFKYFLKYPDEFTVRSVIPSGNDSELRKIYQGTCEADFILCLPLQSLTLKIEFHSWLIGDLKVFGNYMRHMWRKHQKVPGKEKTNNDGTSDFYAFNLAAVPPEFVKERHHPVK